MNVYLNGITKLKNGLKIRLPYSIGFNINEMVDSAGLQFDESSELEILFLVAFSLIPGNVYATQARPMPEPTIIILYDVQGVAGIAEVPEVRDAAGNVTTAHQAAVAAVPAANDVEVLITGTSPLQNVDGGLFAKQIFDDLELGKGYLLDLARAQQSKPLNASNIRNYFAAKGMPKVNPRFLLSVVQSAATAFPVLKGLADVGPVIADDPWMKYRLSASSSPTLVKKFLTETTILSKGIWSLEDIEAVDDALADLEDLELSRKIPRNLLIATYQYLRAMGDLPDDWWQGIRAVQEGSSVYANSWFFASKKFKELGGNKEKIEASTTIVELNEILRLDLIGS